MSNHPKLSTMLCFISGGIFGLVLATSSLFTEPSPKFVGIAAGIALMFSSICMFYRYIEPRPKNDS